MSIDPRSPSLQPDIIESIEKSSTRMVCQAVWDFKEIAKKQFSLARDLAGTVGEDITRDAMETMGVSRIPTARIIGKIDYKRAAYYFSPAYSLRQALLVDSKAEKGEVGNITIQKSQTSLRIRMSRPNEIDVPGDLDAILDIDQDSYLSTTIFVKYAYEVLADGNNRLNSIHVVCLPNGMLQDQYNPTASDSFWLVGRNAPSLGEDFRVRVSLARLKAKKSWRVQTIATHPEYRWEWAD